MHNHTSSQKDAFPLVGIHCRSAGGLVPMKKGSMANATLQGHGSNLSHEQNQHIAASQDNYAEMSWEDQPFGSMPRLSSSRRSSLLIQPALLSSPSSFIATANRSDSSTSRRSCTTCRSFWFSLVDIGVHRYILRFEVINVHHCIAFSKAKPGSVSPLTGPLTTNDKARIEVAMSDHITPLTGRNSLTQNKFIWRFLALSRTDNRAKPCRISVEAYTELEARQTLAPHFILSLAARLPVQEVSHA
ncbi:host cell division inhibitor Icd-like protein [Serratia sp. TMDUHS_CL]|uniref:host cell division inhibitor Icd-like protein n=1 Tax=Serratia sp. TMDUHS_CL TaxID=3128862 RepID=UPI003016107E